MSIDFETGVIEDDNVSKELSLALFCQEKVRGISDLASGLFVEMGRWLWKIRTHQLWLVLSEDGAYPSFDAWCADPEQNLNPSSANLAAQVYDLFVVFYHIEPLFLQRIGEKKYQILAPTINKMVLRFMDGRSCDKRDWSHEDWLVWGADRKAVLGWLEDGRSLSYTDLSDKIAYKTKGRETFFRGKISMAMLRNAASIADILDMLSISDLPDGAVLNCVLTGQVSQIQTAIEDDAASDDDSPTGWTGK